MDLFGNPPYGNRESDLFGSIQNKYKEKDLFAFIETELKDIRCNASHRDTE